MNMFPVTEEENKDQSTTSGQIEGDVSITLLNQRILNGVQGVLTVVLVMEMGEESLENKMGKMGVCSQVFPLRETGRFFWRDAHKYTTVVPGETRSFQEERKAVLLL